MTANTESSRPSPIARISYFALFALSAAFYGYELLRIGVFSLAIDGALLKAIMAANLIALLHVVKSNRAYFIGAIVLRVNVIICFTMGLAALGAYLDGKYFS